MAPALADPPAAAPAAGAPAPADHAAGAYGTVTPDKPKPGADHPPPPDAPQKPLHPPSDIFINLVLAATALLVLLAIGLVVWFTKSSAYSLTEALSEESEDGVLTDAAGAVVKDAAGNPVKKYKMVGSASRLIALLGSVVLVALYAGFGIFTLYFFASGQGVPTSTKDFLYVLAGGMSLFAPYIVNKFASVFEFFKK